MPSLPGTPSTPSQIGSCLRQPWPEEGDLHRHYVMTIKKTRYLRIQDRLFQTILGSNEQKYTDIFHFFIYRAVLEFTVYSRTLLSKNRGILRDEVRRAASVGDFVRVCPV